MLGFIVFIIKLIIGGVISYILPSISKRDISKIDHIQISCIGIFSTSIFSVCIQIDPQSSYILSSGAMVLIALFSHGLSSNMENLEKVLFYSCVVVGLFIGFGYILQGIILSFLVYYITNNRADLFTLLADNKDDSEEENIN